MNFDSLVNNIFSVQEHFQAQAAHAINHALTARNWIIGYNIVEFEQNGEDRAAYGQRLLKNIEERLKTKGLTERRFREFRRLYLIYPQLMQPIMQYISGNTEIRRMMSAEFGGEIRRMPSAEFEIADNQSIIIPGERLFNRLSFSHLAMLSVIDDPLKRAFYEMEAMNGCWSVSELDRQISSLYYERSGLSKNKEALSAMANKQAIQLSPQDILHEPVALEFLGLKSRETMSESALEEALIDHLQEFLMEMGRGFCFEARQKRILIDLLS